MPSLEKSYLRAFRAATPKVAVKWLTRKIQLNYGQGTKEFTESYTADGAFTITPVTSLLKRGPAPRWSLRGYVLTDKPHGTTSKFSTVKAAKKKVERLLRPTPP